MKVMIDPGHYSACVNQSPVDPTYYESATVWKLANYLADSLRSMGVLVGMTRTDINENPGLVERGHMASGYDLFVSVHTNATGNSQGSETANWPVCFTQVSGASTEIGERIGKALMPLFNATKYECYSVSNAQGTDYYGVLRGAAKVGVPGLIVEHGFHTCKADVELLKDDAFLRLLADTDAQTIVAYLKEKEGQVVEQPSSTMLYGVVANVPDNDVLNVRIGAGSTFDRLKEWPALGNGNEVDVCGRNDNQTWLYIRIAGQYFGWVSAKYIKFK
jgi:N-acetylmuramoyl-L-alanine amidase